MKVRNSHVQSGRENIPAEETVWVTGQRWETDLKKVIMTEA